MGRMGRVAKNKQNIIAELSVELPRHDLPEILVTLTNDGPCENCDTPTASLSINPGDGTVYTVMELTPDALMLLSFTLMKFARNLEGKDV